MKEDRGAEVHIELAAADIALAKVSATEQSPVAAAEQDQAEAPAATVEGVGARQPETQSEEYTQIQSEAYSDEFDVGEQNKSDGEEPVHLATVQQEPIETTQGNLDEHKSSKAILEKAKALFEENNDPPAVPVDFIAEPPLFPNEQAIYDISTDK